VADLIGRSGGRVLAVFGTGVQAWFHVEVFTRLFSIGEVLVYGHNPASSEEFAGRIQRQFRTQARPAVMRDLKRADLICTCTTSSDPVFEWRDIRPGVHITGIGSYRPRTREIGTDVVKNSTVIVDTYEGALKEAGDILIPITEGAITREHLYASIAELVSGAKQAPDDQSKTTLFKSVGMALEDLVAADLAYRKALENGIGTQVQL
jgi:ornithine cyclodeaminase/alanine dehydrogenase-like protein (mu-crystallin family)